MRERKTHAEIAARLHTVIATRYWREAILHGATQSQTHTMTVTEAKVLGLPRTDFGRVTLSEAEARAYATTVAALPPRTEVALTSLDRLTPSELRHVAEHRADYIVLAYWNGKRTPFELGRDFTAGSSLVVMLRADWKRQQAALHESQRAELVYSHRDYALTQYARTSEAEAKASRYTGPFLTPSGNAPETTAEVGAVWSAQFESENSAARARLRALQSTIEAQDYVRRLVAEAGGWDALAQRVLADVLEGEAEAAKADKKASKP